MHMRETAEQLAAALRALYPLVPFDGNHDDETRKGPHLKAAREALARYDAERAQAEAWSRPYWLAATDGDRWAIGTGDAEIAWFTTRSAADVALAALNGGSR